MDYKYRIVIKTWQPFQYGSGCYQDTCERDIIFPDEENVKQFIERYGATRNAALFLEELLNLCFPKPSHDQITNWASLDHETLRQTAEQLWKDQESLRITKLELENKVSDLSRTKENREVKKLKEEKVDLQQEKEHLKSQVAQLQKKLENLQQQLSSQQTQNNHHYQDYKRNYQELVIQWNKLTQDYAVLQKRLIGTHTIEQENEKLKKSRQTLENRVQEIEQELRETQQKLSLATTRLRGVNTHSELGGGGSRSDQLKKEFSLLKPTIREVSTRILTGWQSQGFKSSASNDFKSEEFLKIRSILSQRVFGDGMVYFAKDKTEVDAELNLVMDEISRIKDFNPTSTIFEKIQEKVQVVLLRSKGVDHSDKAIGQYIEETVQQINQDLQKIADLRTTDEALDEIKNFLKVGLKLVRDIVNDANSGELFIPENGTVFDDNAHDTRDDPKGQIKMTICAGYRIKETVLVKADVMTYEPEATSPANKPDSVNSQSTDPQNPQPEGEIQESKNLDVPKVEDIGNTPDSPTDQGESTSTEPLSQDSSQEHPEAIPKNLDPNELGKSSGTFKGKVTCSSGLMFRCRPEKEAKTGSKAAYNEDLNFEGWVVGEPWKEGFHINQKQDDRWYKVAGQNLWLPAIYIEGEPPNDMEPMEYPRGDDGAR